MIMSRPYLSDSYFVPENQLKFLVMQIALSGSFLKVNIRTWCQSIISMLARAPHIAFVL
jgi:hypothetical protein